MRSDATPSLPKDNQVPLPGAELFLIRDWIEPAQADLLLDRLLEGIAWETHRIRLFGRSVDSPRRSCWIGDPDASYAYSGARFEPHPWPAPLADLRARLSNELGAPFNSVLANLYRDGRDYMGWHSDDERELGARPVIASVSLGAERRLLLKHRVDPSIKWAAALAHGSLLVMAGDTQRNYRHSLPRTARPMPPRINLTFRQVGPARA